MTHKHQRIFPLILATVTTFGLGACANTMDRLNNVGKDPQMTQISNPVQQPGYQPVSMPMPAKRVEVTQANSLWTSGRKSFFKDQRASQVGDILTVMVEIRDEAKLENRSQKIKNSSQGMDVPDVLGFESYIGDKILPDAATPTGLFSVGSADNTAGQGRIERDEEVTLKVAAVVTQILPNGNMVIQGRQQVRVSNERRDLEVAGIIRPEDITTNNIIPYEKIAEARISYGGQGMLTDANRPRYGTEVMDILLPF